MPASVLQSYLDAVAAGTASVPMKKAEAREHMVHAHRDVETGTRPGKLVLVTR